VIAGDFITKALQRPSLQHMATRRTSHDLPREPRARPDFVRPESVPEDALTTVFTVCPEQAGHRLDRWLTLQLPRLTRSRAQRIVAEWAFDLSGRQLRASHRVRDGESIVVFRPRWDEPDAPRYVTVLYEDEHLVALDKPAGLPVHPTARYHQNTLTSVLSERFPGERIALAHRLDRETSGIVLAGRTLDAERTLKAAFANREVHKTYLALVHGNPSEDAFEVDAPMALEGGDVAVKMCVRAESEGGVHALTRVEIVERYQGFTLVAAHPETGRQHQIRVHLAHAGYPIVGDKLYAHGHDMFVRCLDAPPDEETMAILLLPRHALHAHAIEFAHPYTGETTRIVAPLPDDIRTLCEQHRSEQSLQTQHIASKLDAQ
jgi:23S rRNA pseudouridine1911/1915/1917 synthase